jgi:hypothetical protein
MISAREGFFMLAMSTEFLFHHFQSPASQIGR